MLVKITLDEALLIAALDKLTSKDQARPVLGGINFEWKYDGPGEGFVMEAVVTDSYVLATRKLIVDADDFEEEFDFDLAGSALVNGKEFADAVKAVAKATPRPMKERARILLAFPSERERGASRVVGVTGDIQGTPAYSLRVIDGSFPKWRKLFDGQSSQHDGEMPAFSPYHMSRLMQATAATPTGLRRGTPIKFTSGGDTLKPFGVIREANGVSKFTGLIMPVRT